MSTYCNNAPCELPALLTDAIFVVDQNISSVSEYAMLFQDDVVEGLPVIADHAQDNLDATLESLDAITDARDALQQQLDKCIGCTGLSGSCQFEQIED